MSHNPTDGIDVRIQPFLDSRHRNITHHRTIHVADYSVAFDAVLRRKLGAISLFRSIARLTTSHITPLCKQYFNLKGLAVKPNQAEDIYNLGVGCAKTLGIGVPSIFIINELSLNAFTVATDDLAPVITLTSGLIDALDHDELRFIIGHECGHIHNLHGIYNTLAEILGNELLQTLIWSLHTLGIPNNSLNTIRTLTHSGLRMFMLMWRRYAEVTSDRAGLICTKYEFSAERALAKLVLGHSTKLQQINIDEYLKQLTNVNSIALRWSEAFNTHPLLPKRIEAVRLFAQCDVFQRWRPELEVESPLSKDFVDQRCKEIFSFAKRKQNSDFDIL